MSVDPLGSAAVPMPSADALVEAELHALAADAQALQAKVSAGDVVTATVLPSNGLTDLLQILGSRVAASLPPTLQPGDQLTAQVTGFNGTQIMLQVMDVVSAEDAAANGTAAGSQVPAESAASGASGALASPPPFVANGPTGTIPTGPLAPPSSAFVAASVRPAGGTPGYVGLGAGQPDLPLQQPSTAPLSPLLGSIEARLAASRAGTVAPSVATAPGGPGATPARSFVAPPPIISTRLPTPPVPETSGRAAAAAGPPTADEGAGPSGAPRPTAATFTDPLALVRALRLPNTATNVGAAKLALASPGRLPAALATLEHALPASDDPRVATLRTLIAFVGKLDPQSPQLATQIAAYVDHVVDGPEPKLAQLLGAQAAADASAEPPPAESAAVAADGAPSAASPPAAAAQAAAPPAAGSAASGTAPDGAEAPLAAAVARALPVVALAAIVQRTAALAADLKTTLFALLNGPAAPGAPDELVPAAASALAAVTGVQLDASQALAANPGSVSFALPIWQGNGYAQARIAVDRDAPDGQGTQPLDGDNFHIAFVLDTKHLGTVVIDLQTVGRTVALAVKTEGAGAAARFGDALGRLTGRLETLNYKVATAEASVVTAAPVADASSAPSVPVDDDPGVSLNVSA